MAYYERDYYREPPKRSANIPPLGVVGKYLLALIGGGFVILFFATQSPDFGVTALEGHWLSHLVLTPHALIPFESGWPAPWQLLSAALIERNFLNVVLTCLVTVWWVGSQVERAIGVKPYVVLIVTALLIGNGLAACIDPLLLRGGVISLGTAPLSAALFVAVARLYPDQRSLFGLKFSTIVYVLLAISALLALNTYFAPGSPHVIQSLPAMAGAAAWSVFYCRHMRGAGSRVARKKADAPEDFLAYVDQFKVDDGSDHGKKSDAPKSITRQRNKAEARRAREEAELNALLDRIAKEGISSLSRSEKAFLQRVSRDKRENQS